MRDKLVRDIKRKFGPVFGSEQLKAQRQEIITNALDRYDEEIQNGASEADAYHAAYGSIGNMKELKDSLGLRDKRNFWVAFIIIVVSVLLVAASAVVSAHTKTWFLLIGMLIAVAIVGTAIWRLATGNIRSIAPHIIAIVIGGHILIYVSILTFLGGLELPFLACQTSSYFYDYTEQSNQVESFAYVQITEIQSYGQGEKSDIFEYTVLEDLASDSHEAIIKDLAALNYRYPRFGHPFFINANKRGILIKYKDVCPDLVYVLYCEYGYAVVRKCERGIEVDNYGPYCNEVQWKQLIQKYVKGTYD